MDQPLRAKTFALADATLSGGMRSATATGTRPARLVEAADKYFDTIASTSSSGTGIVMDPDGLHFWFCDSVNNRIRKIKISDGTTITTFTSNASDGGARVITTPRGLTRRGNFLYAGNAGAGNYLIEIDTVGLVCRIYSNAVVTAPAHVVSGAAGLAWVRAGISGGAATYTELTLAGTGDAAAATAVSGRSLSATDIAADEAGTYIYYSAGVSLVRYKLSDSTTTTLTNATLQSTLPQHGPGSNLRSILFDRALALPLVNHGMDTWWRVNAGMTAYDALAFGCVFLGGPTPHYNQSTVYARSAFDVLAGGGGMIQFAWNATGAPAQLFAHARYTNLGVQRARWSWTPGVAIKILRLAVPGFLGNLLGDVESMPATPALFQAEHNHKRVRFYYSVDGGATRYELDSGADNTLLSGDGRPLLVTAAQTITIDADSRRSIYVPWGPRPFIGGPSGEGPTLLYSKPDPALRMQGAI